MANAYPNAEVVLTGRLAEFRTALRQEIDAASRHEASSAVPLINGKRIGQIGASVQYAFEIENALNLPGDTPGDLLLPDRKPIEVSVVAVDGMAITLSVSEDLGPFIPFARLQSNLTLLMRKLIERIEAKAELPNATGDRLLAPDMHGSPALVDGATYGLNPEQSKAFAAALGLDTTFIQGPPGTGKSWTIGAIATELLHTQRSVLIVSHTNVAVDQALLKMNKYLTDDERQQGLVVRVGDPKDAQLNEQPDLLLSTHVERRSKALVDRRMNLEHALQQRVEKAKALCRMIGLCEWTQIASSDILEMQAELKDLRSQETEATRLQDVLQQLQSQADYHERARADSEQIKETSSKIGETDRLIDATVRQVTASKTAIENTGTELSQAKVVLGQTCAASWLVRKWKGLPNPEEQTRKVQELENAFGKQGLTLDTLNADLRASEQERSVLIETVQRFHQRYRCEAQEVLRRVDAYDAKVRETKARIQELRRDCRGNYASLRKLLGTRLSALVHLGLSEDGADSLEGMLAQIESAHARALGIISNVRLDALIREREATNADIRAIEAELRTIEEDLKRVEQLVIEAARVVATTLTRAYLRDSIQCRRFDTIIIDEASMAPIPAVWVAARAATSSGVVVGDPNQLPPIVISTHELAKKWLGTDVFEASGVRRDHPFFVHLKEQRRMHPHISAVVNALIYGGELSNHNSVQEDGRLGDWYDHDWGHDHPVLLVDTGSLNAWVTSVPRSRGSSRLNFLSAAVCLDIAEQLLRDNRPVTRVGAEPRILVVSPYRPHARLLEIMIEEQNLSGEVRAGTAHSFQGSEADVVIFDLVNDEPQWKVAMFMADYDHDMKRLLNVAITRARRRLVVVGDFKYIQQHGKKAFVGRELIPFLAERYQRVSARDIINGGLAARAAHTQARVYGGEITPSEARIVVTEKSFDSYLRGDMASARERIVIYSPFITQNRLSLFEAQLKAAVDRGVYVYAITKPYADRGKREIPQYRFLEKTLEEWGVVVVHKQRMHEKLIFIDDAILWEGSLNPLSYSDTGEHMERRVSKKVVEEYERTLRLHELLQEYDNGSPVCPICESEVVACEGKDEPYFWRCVQDDCYTRGIDQPSLQNGVITCARCGCPVEYGEWGGKPAWRCTKSRHHHQRLSKTHLRLPKMCALIPGQDLHKLRKYFGLRPQNESGWRKPAQSNGLLF
jgi:phosphatidylserine/phosphatidylglycerophosphate/cardiolipin synthase-like enzyme